jgi:invasion protein IalB
MLGRVACVLAMAVATAAAAQEVRLHMPTPPAKPINAWSTTCVSAARMAAPDCRAETRALLASGQLLAAVTVSVPHDTRKPTILVQTPFGLSLRGGVTLRLDAAVPVRLDVQTCDQGGCYAATVMSDGFLKAMLTAKALTIGFQALNQQPVAAKISLAGFREAYGAVR